MLNKKKLNLSTLKRILLEKGFVIKKRKSFFYFSKLKSFYLTAASSVFIIVISFFLPFSLNLKEDIIVSKSTIENNSKLNFQKVLEGKSIKNKNETIDDGLDIKNLFEDIFSFDQVPTDTVRLSASTIKQLFKETNYNLEDVRKKKLVKPIKLSLLPGEMKKLKALRKKRIYLYKLSFHLF